MWWSFSEGKAGRLASKLYLTVFWDNQGILLEEYASKGVTTKQETYFGTLLCLYEAIKKCLGKLSQGVIFAQQCQTSQDSTHHISSQQFSLGHVQAPCAICPISYHSITIFLRTFIGGWEGNDFSQMQKWKPQSITTSKNWTKIFMLLALQSYLTAAKNALLASVTM